ncbi:winged helix-turn-helix domain-containing protein [Metabacillus dongyingensis]|uniref:winged helix-turn-helix domain-containing protein n=1 Tax=Metabacillus dongyingensis TaxID=2874282 RepID=UPI003B8B8720
MKSLTTTKYDVSQVCALLKITVATFNRHKEKYMTELKKEYNVEIEIGARNKKFYLLTPKKSEMTILKDVTPEVREVKNKALKNIELILKAVLIDNVIPIHDEIIKNTGLSQPTVKRCIKKMKESGILIEPEEKTVQEHDVYTGEIYEYTKKSCSYVYYDNAPNGRKTLNFPNIHSSYGQFYGEKLKKLHAEHRSNFERKIALNVASFHAWKELNLLFCLHDGNRAEKWIVSSKYKQLIKEKHCHY